MHCFIPFDDYSEEKLKSVGYLMIAEMFKQTDIQYNITSRAAATGVHVYTYYEMDEHGHVIDESEPITDYHMVNQGIINSINPDLMKQYKGITLEEIRTAMKLFHG